LATGGRVSTSTGSAVFEVRRGAAAVPVALTMDPPPLLYVQTYPTSNEDRQEGDTIIEIWDSNGQLVEYDYYDYDTFGPFTLTLLGTYWIRISPWGIYGMGEYALWLGSDMQPEPAPGTFANPGSNGIPGSQAHTQSAAQLIKANDKVVYGDMTWDNLWDGDWYKFIVE